MVDIAELSVTGKKSSDSGRLRWQLPSEDDDGTAAQDKFRELESESTSTSRGALERFRNAATAVVGQGGHQHGGIECEEETRGETSATSWTEPSVSIQKFREVANTLAAEAIRRRRGLSEFALNQALSKLPSIWSHDEAQAEDTAISRATERPTASRESFVDKGRRESGANCSTQRCELQQPESAENEVVFGSRKCSRMPSRASARCMTGEDAFSGLATDAQWLPEVCAKAPEERMDRELEPLLRILEKIEFTASLDASIQRELARYMRFLSVQPGTVIFSQGDVGDLFYIILSGSVAVKVTAGDAVTVARTLRAGKSFGELALLQKGGLRSATVVSCGITNTEFLTIAADQYEELLSNLHQAEIRSKVDVVRHCKIFRGWPESDLYHVAAVMQAHKYGPNVTVVEQGSDADSMCFIKSGRVRVMRRVPASQSLKEMMEQDPTLRDSVCSPHGRTERYRAAPYQPLYEARPLPARTPAAYNARRSPPCGKGPPSHEQHGQPSSAQNNRPESSQDEVWVHVCTLGPHDSFGELAVLNGSKRGASVITTTLTELLVLTRHDVLSLVTGQARLKLEALSDRYTSDDAMLGALEEGLRWERYKKGLVASILWERGRQSHLLDYSAAHTTAVQKRQVWK